MSEEVSEEVSFWRKSRRSGGATNCVELSRDGRVRDSKNPGGPTLFAVGLLALARHYEVKSGT